MTATTAACLREPQVSLLEMKGIAMRFGAIEALAGVDFSLEAGSITGLMGDNGAGKSTLVKIIAGNFPPTEGEVLLEGKPVHFHKPADARAAGIEVVYQDLALCNNLTASANVFLGRELTAGWGPLKIVNDNAMNARAKELFAELKSETRPPDKVHRMSGGQRQAVAIARTHLSKAKIVLMDEPTAAIIRAPGGRGARSPETPARPGHRRAAHQPPHARRLRGCRPHRRAAPRPQGGRQDHPEKLA